MANEGGWQVVYSKAAGRKKGKPAPRAPPLPDPVDRPVLKVSGQDFVPPLAFNPVRNDDSYFNVAGPTLSNHNTSTFNHYLDPLKLFAIAYRPQYSRTHRKWTRIFALGRDRLVVTVSMFLLHPRRRSEGPQQLMVVNGDSASHFGSWLSTLPLPAESRATGPRGYELLHQYHTILTQHKRPKHTFNTMPADIKKEILLQMIGEVRPVHFTNSNHFGPEVLTLHKSTNKWYNRDQIAGNAPILATLDPRLFTLNQATSAALQTILRCWTIKAFDHPYSLKRLIENGSQSALTTLNRIQLNFNDIQFLEFFGKNLPRLPRKAYIPYTGNPWGYGSEFPCRKGMVDAIVLGAWPYISHITQLNLVGCVKTESRDKWLGYLATRRRPGTQRKLEEEARSCMLPPWDEASPFLCKCPVPCYYTRMQNAEGGDSHQYRAACKAYRFDFDDRLDGWNEYCRHWDFVDTEKHGRRHKRIY